MLIPTYRDGIERAAEEVQRGRRERSRGRWMLNAMGGCVLFGFCANRARHKRIVTMVCARPA